MSKLFRFLLFPLLAFTIQVSFAQSRQDKKLAKDLDLLLSGKHSSISPGCAVLVAKKGKIVYKKAFGIANLELNVALKPEMVFRIGSITKQYTAIAILQLVEQGKISLGDSLQKYIRDFPSKGHTVTIENLLNHTSGIIGYDALDFKIPSAHRVEFSPKRIVDSLRSIALQFTPGSRYHYSNSNYFMLAYIIEIVSGKSYRNYLQENIFNPAGLTQTYYDSRDIIPNRVSGYRKINSRYSNAEYISMSSVYGAGALMANVEDLFKWHQALYSFGLVQKETLEKAFTPFKLSDGKLSEYGYGWFIKEVRGEKSIGHGGAIDGFRSMDLYLPEQDVFIAALFNSESDDFFSLFENMTDLAIGKFPTDYKDLAVPDTILNSYAGSYVSTDSQYLNDTIRIYKGGKRLYCDLSNKSGIHMELFAASQTLFYIPIIKRVSTSIEFIVEDGKVKGAYWIQKEKHETRKVK